MRLLPRGGASILFPLVVLLLLAGMTYWLARALNLDQPGQAPLADRGADYEVNRFTVIRLSDTGQARHVLTADRMVHFPSDDSSLLVRPQLTQTDGASRIRISAQRGVMAAGGEETILTGNVEVVRIIPAAREGTAPEEPLVITTERLRVRPDDDRADTTLPVRVRQGASTLTGTGMELDNRYRRVRVLADVRAMYSGAAPAKR